MLDGQDPVGLQFLAGQREEPGVRVECAGGQDPPGEGEPLVQAAQHGADFRDLVRLHADLPLGDHDAAGGGRQQERAGPVGPDRAADLLAVAVQRRLRHRPRHRELRRRRQDRGREVAGRSVGQGLRPEQAQHPGHRPPARRLPPAVPAGAGPGRGQHVLVRVLDPREDIGELRLAAQHRHHHQRQDARQRMPDPAPARVTRVRDRREAVPDAPPGCPGQRYGPAQQRPPRLIRRSAQPLLFRPLPFPPLSGLPLAFGLPAPPFLLPAVPPALPGLLPPGGPADDLLRRRDHRLVSISGRGHARLVTQRGLPGR